VSERWSGGGRKSGLTQHFVRMAEIATFARQSNLWSCKGSAKARLFVRPAVSFSFGDGLGWLA
jgi:hypothetical protein